MGPRWGKGPTMGRGYKSEASSLDSVACTEGVDTGSAVIGLGPRPFPRHSKDGSRPRKMGSALSLGHSWTQSPNTGRGPGEKWPQPQLSTASADHGWARAVALPPGPEQVHPCTGRPRHRAGQPARQELRAPGAGRLVPEPGKAGKEDQTRVQEQARAPGPRGPSHPV